MTLEQFKNKVSRGETDPAIVPKIVRCMSTLKSSQLYKRGLFAKGTSEDYGQHCVKAMCLRLDEDYGSEAVREFGTGLLQAVLDYPEAAQISTDDRAFCCYYDILVFLAALPSDFDKP